MEIKKNTKTVMLPVKVPTGNYTIELTERQLQYIMVCVGNSSAHGINMLIDGNGGSYNLRGIAGGFSSKDSDDIYEALCNVFPLKD